MELAALLSTALGAIIALSGTLLADIRRDRKQRDRDRELDRWRNCVDFTLALDAAHAALREVAADSEPRPDRRAAASRAVHDAGMYGVRERLLMSGTVTLVKAGEVAFLKLIAIRDAVRAGVTLHSGDYHRVYHPFAEALWTFRMAVRADFGQGSLTPEVLGRTSWSEKEDCADCASSRPAPVNLARAVGTRRSELDGTAC